MIRKAEKKDILALLEIYNHEVRTGVATLDINEKTPGQWTEWFNRHNIKNHPLIVFEENETVKGYASLSSYREKEAYSATVELSIYVHPEHRGKGIGTALMKAILDMARADESIHNVVSVITSGNTSSERLHDKFGFTFCGKIREAGIKFDRLIDISNYQLFV